VLDNALLLRDADQRAGSASRMQVHRGFGRYGLDALGFADDNGHQELFLEGDKAMKKTLKKLHLNRDTLRELMPRKLELARGGTAEWTNFTACICTLGEDCVTGLCISDACPTALCA
jgi:hypothetical protein